MNMLNPGDLALSNSVAPMTIASINAESGTEGVRRCHLEIKAKTGEIINAETS